MIFDETVRWETLKPAEFMGRRTDMPVVYLPMGLCEPHGHIAPFGLDTIKADWLCDQAAKRFGGIVAPTMNYHVHEAGYHGPWLKEVMGGVNPLLAALPPHLLLETLLYQLRAFRNAGFQACVIISGHHGSQEDLRMVADLFARTFPLQHFVRTDPELVAGHFTGDHAGRYELSQLLAIRLDLVAMERADRITADPLGRFAQNPDVVLATADEGKAILEAALIAIGIAVRNFSFDNGEVTHITFDEMKTITSELHSRRDSWMTL
jgi:creatinine amidohydrolase